MTTNDIRTGHEINQKLLSIYLNDHLAALTAEVELARRAARAADKTENAVHLDKLADHLRQDREELRRTMKKLDCRPRRSKAAAGRVAERLGRLKPNGKLIRRSRLSDVVELEGLRLGLAANEALWQAMRQLADHDSRLKQSRYAKLQTRTKAQSVLLDEMSSRAVESALLRS